MFNINLRRLLRVLFILGLLLPTYVLPNNTTSTPVFAEEGRQDQVVLETKKQSGQCKGVEICIDQIKKPDFGEKMGSKLLLVGRFPEGMLRVAVRNPEGEVVYQQSISHKGGNTLDLGVDFQWQEGSHTVTVMLNGALVGDTFDLDVVESNGDLIRKKESAFDIEKIKKPLIGQIITNGQIEIIGRFDFAPVEITLRFPNGEVVQGKTVKHEENKLVVRFQEIPHDIGVYKLSMTSRSDHTDTISFAVGVSDSTPSIRGCARVW